MSESAIELGRKTVQETSNQDLLLGHLRSGLIPDNELIANAHVFLRRQTFARLLQLKELYDLILDIPGIIMQCGVRWGGDLLALQSLRSLYEPYNYSRRIIGFDTFEGLLGTQGEDQGIRSIQDGQYSVSQGYMQALDKLLDSAEKQAPLPHIKKYQLYQGDASQTVPEFLTKNQGEMISMLYLDMDIYKPTYDVLEACLERLLPGSVVVFDEYSAELFPGEAKVYREFAGRLDLEMRRSRLSTVTAYGIKR